jgi:hypothetical protein
MSCIQDWEKLFFQHFLILMYLSPRLCLTHHIFSAPIVPTRSDSQSFRPPNVVKNIRTVQLSQIILPKFLNTFRGGGYTLLLRLALVSNFVLSFNTVQYWYIVFFRGWFLGYLTTSLTCFICCPSDSTVSEDAGIEPRTVAPSVGWDSNQLPYAEYCTVYSMKITIMRPGRR